MNLSEWHLGGRAELENLVSIVKEANPSARLSLGCFVAVGSGPSVERVKRIFGDGPLSGMAGSANEVAETLLSYESLGISGAMLAEFAPGSFDALASVLL